MTSARFVALPARHDTANLILLTSVFAVTFVVLYGFTSSVSALIPWRISVALPLDEQLPFWPATAAIYLTITPMLLLAPFVLRDLASLLPLFLALMLETSIGALCFMLLPIDPPAITCCEGALTQMLFDTADTLNLERNDLPSLHVAFVVTAALAFAPRAGGFGRFTLLVWASCVAASTVLTRQHRLLDVVAGVLLAFVCWGYCRARARRPEVLAAFNVELLCMRNFARFVRRHRRYLLPVVAVLGTSALHWRRHRLTRTGFAFLQSLDDLLDGDRPSDIEPLEIADESIGSFQSGDFGQHDLARLGAAFRAELLARGDLQSLAVAIGLMRSMRRDRERVLSRELLPAPALIELHRATFRGSLDLLLLAADSPLRAADVPDLVDAFGWCSTVRDLDEDLEHGLVNIPREVVEQAITIVPAAPLAALTETRAVQEWSERERQRALTLLDAADARLNELHDRRGAMLLRMFARSIRRYTRT